MVTLSVVIYRQEPAALSRLLRSCLGIRKRLSSICVVDNSPGDGLRGIVQDHGFTYLHRPDNPGFGASHNFAFASLAGDSKYHFIVNPDVQFEQDDAVVMIDYMERHDDVGLVVPRVIYPNGTIQDNRTLLPTPMNVLLRRFFEGRNFAEKLNSRFQLRHLKYDKAIEIPAATGCFMLVRSSVYRQIGGFDERFFMYFEDFDLTRRIANVAKTVYLPMATVIHEHARESHGLNRLFLVQMASALKYFNKWGWLVDRERDVLNNHTLSQMVERQ